MSEKEFGAAEIEEKVHDLARSMDRIRSAHADAQDVVVDMKHAKHSRLELLAKDLLQVMKDVPDDNDQFEFALTKGEAPRLWIDMTTFVRMGKDGREYEFVKDTRIGRSILGRTDVREVMGAHVTDYVAERILERERAIEGEWIGVANLDEQGTNISNSEISEGYSGWAVFGWFITGLIIGAGALIVAARNGQLENIMGWLFS